MEAAVAPVELMEELGVLEFQYPQDAMQALRESFRDPGAMSGAYASLSIVKFGYRAGDGDFCKSNGGGVISPECGESR